MIKLPTLPQAGLGLVTIHDIPKELQDRIKVCTPSGEKPFPGATRQWRWKN